MRRRLGIIAAIAVVVLVALGGAAWWLFIRDDSPPPPELSTVDPGTVGEEAAASGELDGTWNLVPDPERYVGYRVPELFGGDTMERDGVARTAEVTGELTIADDELTSVEVTADMTALESEDPTAGRRDRYLRTNAIETDEYPEASFSLTEPFDLKPLPAENEDLQVEITGDLTLHGVTAPVTATLDARWTGDTIEVAGAAPIVLADFDIEPPDIPGLAKVDEEGAFELLLVFERAPG